MTKTISTKASKGIHHKGLKCSVINIIYNFAERSGLILMEPNNCPDMAGSIALFKRIDPKVTRIVALTGPSSYHMGDTSYHLIDGQWIARGLQHDEQRGWYEAQSGEYM